jgi:acyl-homoserine-lactone acylase
MAHFEALPARRRAGRSRRWLSLVLATLCVVAGTASAAVGASGSAAGSGQAVGAGAYQATIVRTSYGIPHITAANYGSLGFGYGYAFATDDLCTMADDYVTVEGRRSRYFGPDGSYVQVGSPAVNNLDSDLYWKSIGDDGTVRKMLAVTEGPSAILPQVRQLISGYVAGYDRYLASVGGAKGVPDPTCRGKAWVKPINVLDAYLRMYQLVDIEGFAGDPGMWTGAQPPAVSTTAATMSMEAETVSMGAETPSVSGLAAALAADKNGAPGSNALAIGSAGTQGGDGAGILLGNPHFPWDGAERFYEVQMTIPGQFNVEGATLYGSPQVVIGFNSSVAWSHTDTPSFPMSLYQLTLVPGHPTEYVYGGKDVAMTKTTSTVLENTSSGRLEPVTRTLWNTRWGPVVDELEGESLPWTSGTAFVLADADADASNARFMNDVFTTDRATDTARILAGQEKYEGMPWVDTIAADSQGHALYTDVGNFPDITNALAAHCDTTLGTELYQEAGMPVFDGSNPSCTWGTDPDSVAPGIFGANEEPKLSRSDYVENSNMSYWLTNASDPMAGYPPILGLTDIPADLRTRSALTMIQQRLSGADGLGPAGFTLQGVQNLMYEDIQYGAAEVKPQLVALCKSLPGGLAPTGSGTTIAVGDACGVLANWNGREDPDASGAVLFRDFWERALALPEGPWATPFNPADPVNTPSGLNADDKSVVEALGDALQDLKTAGLPYGVTLGTVQYVVRNGVHIALPGGPGDPDGDFNAIYQNVLTRPGADPTIGSSYIQAVSWSSRGSGGCPVARTVLTYSESDNPDSPHYADQTELFSRKGWVNAAFCASDVAAQAVSVQVVRGSAAG